MTAFRAPLKRVSLLTLGNMIGYGFSLLLLPLLARIYPPAAFGIFGLLFALTQIGGLAATLRLEKAIFVSDTKSESESLARCAYAISGLVAVLIGVLLSMLYLIGKAPELWLYIPILLFSQSAILIEIALGNYQNRYKRSAIGRGLQGAAPSIAALALAQFTNQGLVHGFLAAQITTILYLRLTAKAPLFDSLKQIRIDLKAHLSKHRNFALYTAPHEITGALSAQATSLLIPSFFGPATAGIYFIAQKCAMLPSVLVGSATAQVYLHELGKVRDQSVQRKRVFLNTLAMASASSAVFFTPIYFFAPILIEIIFGDTWTSAVHYTQIIAPWAALHLVGSILSQTPQTLNAQRTAMLIELANAATRIGLLTIGYLLNSALLGIVLFVASSIMFSGGRIIWYSRLINRK